MKIDIIESKIQNLILHKVGNKVANEELIISKEETQLDEDLSFLLSHYFLSHFKFNEKYSFYHDVELSLNETYYYVSRIFNNPNFFIEHSKNLARYLYSLSTHPKIKGGEFYIVYFNNCFLNEEKLEAIGLFKSENKDTFLEIEQKDSYFGVDSKKGININKLDKGCLIFNTPKQEGYLVSIVDNTNRLDAQYWKDDFLGIEPVKDEFHQTNEFLDITKQFLTNKIQDEFEISKTDQIDLLNRSVDYFKTHDVFDRKEFEEDLFEDDTIKESFKNFSDSYQEEKEFNIPDSFEISDNAVKKQARAFKRILKLDENFQIHIKGNRDLIEKGIDEKGRKFYKIYYKEEK